MPLREQTAHRTTESLVFIQCYEGEALDQVILKPQQKCFDPEIEQWLLNELLESNFPLDPCCVFGSSN